MRSILARVSTDFATDTFSPVRYNFPWGSKTEGINYCFSCWLSITLSGPPLSKCWWWASAKVLPTTCHHRIQVVTLNRHWNLQWIQMNLMRIRHYHHRYLVSFMKKILYWIFLAIVADVPYEVNSNGMLLFAIFYLLGFVHMMCMFFYCNIYDAIV